MTRIVYITILVVALLVLALGGWTVQGLRKARAAARPRRRPTRLAAAAPGF